MASRPFLKWVLRSVREEGIVPDMETIVRDFEIYFGIGSIREGGLPSRRKLLMLMMYLVLIG